MSVSLAAGSCARPMNLFNKLRVCSEHTRTLAECIEPEHDEQEPTASAGETAWQAEVISSSIVLHYRLLSQVCILELLDILA